MKFLIIGASGLVGCNLYQQARSSGFEVVGTCHNYRLPELVPLSGEDKSSVENLLREVQPDAVFYCAAWSWVDGCEKDPARAHRENALFPAQVAASAHEIGSHFTYFSSSYVFDGREGPYSETGATCPISIYGHSKLAGEKAVHEATGGQALIARTMGVYGPEPQRKNFVFQVREALASGKTLRVPHDQFGNATYAPDLAQMAIALASRRQSGIWNLAGPEPKLRRSDFARQIARAYGLPTELIEPVETSSLSQPAPRPCHGGLLIDKVVQATSITPRSWIKID